MRRALLEYRSYWSQYGDYSTKFRPVWLISTHKNTWRIWSWREPFTRLVHKQAKAEKVTEL